MPVPIYNRFHVWRADSGKIRTFMGVPLMTPSFEGNPLTQGHEILSQKTRVPGGSHSKDFMILACVRTVIRTT